MDEDKTIARRNARRLLDYGHTDEDVEHVSGLSLRQIIGLRAEAAARPRSATASPRRVAAVAYVGDESEKPH